MTNEDTFHNDPETERIKTLHDEIKRKSQQGREEDNDYDPNNSTNVRISQQVEQLQNEIKELKETNVQLK